MGDFLSETENLEDGASFLTIGTSSHFLSTLTTAHLMPTWSENAIHLLLAADDAGILKCSDGHGVTAFHQLK